MEESRVTVNNLAKLCARSSDAAEWEELLRRSTPLVAMVVGRVARLWEHGASSTVVDEIVQEVFLKLCEQERRILRDFEPRGEDSFFGLLRTVSASVANDYFRSLHSVKRGGKVVTLPIIEDAPRETEEETLPVARMQQMVLLAQLDKTMRAMPEVVSSRDRSIFWLYYLQGLTAEEVAGLPGVGLSAKGVESALRRVGNWLRKEVAHPVLGG